MSVEVHQFCRKPRPSAFSMERVFAQINATLPADIVVTQIENRHFSGGVLTRLWDALRARHLRGPVNHVVGDVHYLTFFLTRRRTILTIHDCEMVFRARGLKRLLLKIFWLDLPVRRAGYIIAISQQTRDDIVKLTGIDYGRVTVIDNPLSALFRPIPVSPPSRRSPTILHVGTKANKNLGRLIEAAQGLPMRLLIIGKPDELQQKLLVSAELDYEIRFNISDEELLACYAEARALAFVSLSEGFGLPIIEAQAVGRPVLTSNLEPMRSVAGEGGALLVDPENVTAIRAGLLKILRDDALCVQLVAEGRQNMLRFRAERIANRYAELYRHVARG